MRKISDALFRLQQNSKALGMMRDAIPITLLAFCLSAAGVFASSPGDWKSYTNINFVTDIGGDDSTVFLTTTGGVVILQTKPNSPQVKKILVHTDGLGVNRCFSLAKDEQGNLWIGTYGAGLAVIPKDSGKALGYPSIRVATKIRTVAVGGTRILAGTDQGLYVIETKGTFLDFSDDYVRYFTVSKTKELLSDRILSLLVDNANFWIGTNQGVSCVDSNLLQWRAFRQPLGDSVLALTVWAGNKVVLGTELGLAIGDTNGFQPFWVFPRVMKVNDILADGYLLYVATADTVFKVDTVGVAQPFFIERPPQALFLQKERFWVGCGGDEVGGQGLFYLESGQSWQRFDFNCLYSGFINDCAFGKDGSVYLVHGSYGANVVSRILPGSGDVQFFHSPLSWAVQIRCDSKGGLWLGHWSPGGVSAYDPTSNKWKSWSWSGKKNTVVAFGIDRFDTKWVFNQSGTVVAIDSSERQIEFNLPGLAPPPGGGYEFAFDSKNRVYLGLTNGLLEFDYGGTLFDRGDDRATIHSAGLPSTEVRSVAVDHQDRVWVATPQGGAMWDGTDFKVYKTNNSEILSNDLYRVRTDPAGRVWFLSDLGLSIFDMPLKSWTRYTPQNSGIIPNPQGLGGFYTALDLNDSLGLAGIGTARGFSLFNFTIPFDTLTPYFQVYPNPFIFGTHSGVKIKGVPSDARVQIYTLTGKPVVELPVSRAGESSWLPGNVASGIYLIVVSSSEWGVHIEKVAVISGNSKR